MVSRPLRAAGKAYRGINVLMLWAAAMEKGYNCPLWCIYKQAAELGGQVRKGEKGSLVVYADTITKKDTDDKGADIDIRNPLHERFFNAEQVDGLPAHFRARLDILGDIELERLNDADRLPSSAPVPNTYRGYPHDLAQRAGR
jgi:antirestriction protein ArdC